MDTFDPATLPEPEELGEVLLRLLARPAIGAKKAIRPRYDWTTFRTAGDLVVVVGALTGGGVGGSEYLSAEHGQEAGTLPAPDLAREKAVLGAVRRAEKEGLLSSAHDCSAGGLAVALAECCMMAPVPTGEEPGYLGAALRIPFGARKDFVLFGEDPSRVVVSLAHAHLPRLEAIAQLAGAPLVVLGAVGGDRLEIQSALSVPVAELSRAWRGGNPSI